MVAELKAKQGELTKLFLCFPSAKTMDRETVQATVAAYLETLQRFSSETLSAACRTFRQRGGEWPPAAGTIFEACEAVERRKAAEQDHAGRPRAIARPQPVFPLKREWTAEELADETVMINHLSGFGQRYQMRPGRDYGYLTKAEAEWVRDANRRERR